MSWDSTGGIATGCGLDSRGVGVLVGTRLFLSVLSRPVLVPTLPPIQWIPGTISPWVKWPGHEVDRASVKNAWIYTPTPPCVFIV
jgi:hypothetical protein